MIKQIIFLLSNTLLLMACSKPTAPEINRGMLLGTWVTAKYERFAGVNYEVSFNNENRYTLKEVFFSDMLDTNTVNCSNNRTQYSFGTYQLHANNTIVLNGAYSDENYTSVRANCFNRTDFDTMMQIGGDASIIFLNAIGKYGNAMSLVRK